MYDKLASKLSICICISYPDKASLTPHPTNLRLNAFYIQEVHHEDHTNSPKLQAAEAVCQVQEASGVHSQTLAVNDEINEDDSHSIDDNASQDLEPQTAEMPTDADPVEEADQACNSDGPGSNESSMTDKGTETQTLIQQPEPENFCVTAAEQRSENENKEQANCSVDSMVTDNETGTDLMNIEALQPSTSVEREEACTVSTDGGNIASEQPMKDETGGENMASEQLTLDGTKVGRNAIDIDFQPENTIASLIDDVKTTEGLEKDELLEEFHEAGKDIAGPNSQSGAIEAMEVDLPKTQAGTTNSITIQFNTAHTDRC